MINVMALPSDTDTLCLSREDENKKELQADFDGGNQGAVVTFSLTTQPSLIDLSTTA